MVIDLYIFITDLLNHPIFMAVVILIFRKPTPDLTPLLFKPWNCNIFTFIASNYGPISSFYIGGVQSIQLKLLYYTRKFSKSWNIFSCKFTSCKFCPSIGNALTEFPGTKLIFFFSWQKTLFSIFFHSNFCSKLKLCFKNIMINI